MSQRKIDRTTRRKGMVYHAHFTREGLFFTFDFNTFDFHHIRNCRNCSGKTLLHRRRNKRKIHTVAIAAAYPPHWRQQQLLRKVTY